MVAVGIVIELFLWFYILFVLARLVADWVQMFARSWAPRGPVLVLMEVIYTATDPPIRLFRRFIPPLRLGGCFARPFGHLRLAHLLRFIVREPAVHPGRIG